jgi:hypothetical protein
VTGPIVTVFLSTGRCGTQWLAEGLRDCYPALAVEHKPIGALYNPRKYFRRYADPEAILGVRRVASHLEEIERLDQPYVETGWPLFPALPLLAARLHDRLRIVHLTKHPVSSALGHAARKLYAGSPRNDAYTRLATLAPTDHRVFQSFYADCWDTLTPYEKCIFWWTEVHLFALELPGQIDPVPIMRVSSEDLLSGARATLEQLLEFLELPWHDRWPAHAAQLSDRPHRTIEGQAIDPLEVHRHPTTVDVARELGYELEPRSRVMQFAFRA